MSRVSGSTVRHARHDKRDTHDTQHKRKCGARSLAANSSANNFCYERFVIVFGSCTMLKSLLFCHCRKTLSTRFRVKNRNFTEENDNSWQWACWDMSLVTQEMSCVSWREVTWRDGPSGIWAYGAMFSQNSFQRNVSVWLSTPGLSHRTVRLSLFFSEEQEIHN